MISHDVIQVSAHGEADWLFTQNPSFIHEHLIRAQTDGFFLGVTALSWRPQWRGSNKI